MEPGPRPDVSFHRDAVLELQLLAHGAQLLRRVRVHDDLRDPVAVPDIEETDSAVVAMAMDPAVENDRSAGIDRRAGRRRSRYASWFPCGDYSQDNRGVQGKE